LKVVVIATEILDRRMKDEPMLAAERQAKPDMRP